MRQSAHVQTRFSLALPANVIGNAVIVPAGILAVTRAQERGYAIVSIA